MVTNDSRLKEANYRKHPNVWLLRIVPEHRRNSTFATSNRRHPRLASYAFEKLVHLEEMLSNQWPSTETAKERERLR